LIEQILLQRFHCKSKNGPRNQRGREGGRLALIMES